MGHPEGAIGCRRAAPRSIFRARLPRRGLRVFVRDGFVRQQQHYGQSQDGDDPAIEFRPVWPVIDSLGGISLSSWRLCGVHS